MPRTVKNSHMESDTTRSDQVIEDYKKRKLAASALRRIHELIHGFEKGRTEDRRLAWVGVLAIAGILLLAAIVFFNRYSINLS